MDTIVKFHEGLKGSGVVVSIMYGNDRAILDFGMPYRPLKEIFDGKVLHRTKNYVKDLITLNKVPPINGIFDENDIEGLKIESYQDTKINTGIFISHLHLDHMANVGIVHPAIPIYFHKDGFDLQLALEEVGEGVGNRTYNYLELYECVCVNSIKVTAYFSDHPCFGSVGYLVETPDCVIYYSGDIRFHGLQKERAFAELEKLIEKKIDLLIIDGTSFSPIKFVRNTNNDEFIIKPSKDILEGMFLEEKIYADVLDELKKSKKLNVFCIYHRDMQLINALIEISEKSGKQIVFEPKTAYIIYKLLNKKVKFYYPDYTIYHADLAYLKVIKENLEEVSVEKINTNVGDYLIQNSYDTLLSLIDFNTKDGNFFHLFGAPFVKGDRAFTKLENLLSRYQLKHFAYSNLYSFNHAFPNHLSYMIEKLNAKSVVAVHSNTPEKLNPMNSKRYLPKQNVAYILKNGYMDEVNDI